MMLPAQSKDRIRKPETVETFERSPLTSPALVFEALRRRGTYPLTMWRSPEDELVLAAGVAAAYHSQGGNPDWRNEIREVAEKFVPAVASECSQNALRVFFNIHFDPVSADSSGEWRHFPPISFTLPALMLRQDTRGATATLAGDRGLVEAMKSELALVDEADAGAMPQTTAPLYAEMEWNEAPYTIVVEQAVRSLRRRAIDKVVLARQATVKSERPILLPRVLQALFDSYSGCFVYAHAPADGVTFVSVSPERLALVENGGIITAAIAGTSPTGRNLLEEESNRRFLQTNAKIWKEHSMVVEMMHNTLEELCEDVRIDPPEILRLRNVQHLATPIRGRLKNGKSLMDAVSLLHPTPAVCGTPRDFAMEMIRNIEGFSRGQFAGVAGWMDGAGNGDAAVTIRSALVRESSAVLYGGAGILAESSIKQEVDETRAKMQAVLSALAQG